METENSYFENKAQTICDTFLQCGNLQTIYWSILCQDDLTNITVLLKYRALEVTKPAV